MELNMYQVDAFAKEVFQGNPAAVVPLQDWTPDDSVLQAIAAENNLSETAFFVDREDYFHLRWFTPAAEVRLCGHATLASAHVLFHEMNYDRDEILFRTLGGDLRVNRSGDSYSMDFPTDPPEPIPSHPLVEEALGFKPKLTYKGTDDYLALIDSEEQLLALDPDPVPITKLKARGLVVTAPGANTDIASRCFYPGLKVQEDPVTGSAHTMLAPFWLEQLSRTTFSAVQGKGRRGHLQCSLLDDRVVLTGQAVTYLHGTIHL
jgi:PhzF family phenazine biosynthesis protein